MLPAMPVDTFKAHAGELWPSSLSAIFLDDDDSGLGTSNLELTAGIQQHFTLFGSLDLYGAKRTEYKFL
jgi:hypothetical protein